MQDPTPGWTRYIEDLEAQAARLPRRHRPARYRPSLIAALRGLWARTAEMILHRRRPDIEG